MAGDDPQFGNINRVLVNFRVDKEHQLDDVIWWVSTHRDDPVEALGRWDVQAKWGEVFFAVESPVDAAKLTRCLLSWDGERMPDGDEAVEDAMAEFVAGEVRKNHRALGE